MSVFGDRERAFEAKFAHEEDRRLLTVARANRLLAFWAAELMELGPDEREVYAQAVTRHGLEQAEDRAVLLRIRDDLQRANCPVSDAKLEQAFVDRLAKARDQLRFEDLTTPEFQPAA